MHPVRRANAEMWEACFCVWEIKHFHLAELRLREKGALFDLGSSAFILVTPCTCGHPSADWAWSNYSAESRQKQMARPWCVLYLLWPTAISWPYSLFSRAEEGQPVPGESNIYLTLPLLYMQRGEFFSLCKGCWPLYFFSIRAEFVLPQRKWQICLLYTCILDSERLKSFCNITIPFSSLMITPHCYALHREMGAYFAFPWIRSLLE